MQDKEIIRLIRGETRRQEETINLIASENYASSEVREALGSRFTDKYAEGYPGKRYYCGNQYSDKAEELCRARALQLFGLSKKRWHVNVQPYSGSPANMAVYLALVPLGEKIMGLRLDMGGHLTHGHAASATGKLWKQIPYLLDPHTHRLDYAAIRAQAKKEKPRLIVAGFTAYPRTVDFKAFRKIADETGAYLMVDMSHIAGLVAGGVHPSPFPIADVVTTTTHKTMRGPRGAIIFANRASRTAERKKIDVANAIDRAVFPGLQGGPHMNQIAAMATALYEARTPMFRRYARQVTKNAKALATELEARGWRIISGGTDTHLLLVDAMSRGISGNVASDILEKNAIVVNKNTIPYDPRRPADPSGIRIGTPAVTTRGMKEQEMKIIATLVHEALSGKKVLQKTRALCRKFPLKKI